MIQVFHVYKRDYNVFPNISKIWHRILFPFLVIQLTFVGYHLLDFFLRGTDLYASMLHLLKCGGDGPGSYYIWIYLQMAVLCPLFYRIVRLSYAFSVFAFLSILSEIFCSFIQMPDELYRLLCLRYIFLIYLGYLWCKSGIKFTLNTFLLSMLSSVCILVLFFLREKHFDRIFEPIIFDTAWSSFHWFTYFLSWSLLAFTICKFYQIKSRWRCNAFVLLCGRRSYEIFLFQMLVFGVSPLKGYINIIISLLPLLVYERNAVFKIFSLKSIYDKRKIN